MLVISLHESLSKMSINMLSFSDALGYSVVGGLSLGIANMDILDSWFQHSFYRDSTTTTRCFLVCHGQLFSLYSVS